jgi:hypothetical protein
VASDLDPPNHSFPQIWHDRHASPHLAYWLRHDLANFLPELALNQDPLNLCLFSHWNYRYEPPCLVYF